MMKKFVHVYISFVKDHLYTFLNFLTQPFWCQPTLWFKISCAADLHSGSKLKILDVQNVKIRKSRF